MIKLIPFQASHLHKFVSRELPLDDFIDRFRIQETSGPSFTIVADDEIIGCFGIIILWPGAGVAWFANTEKVRQHKIWIVKTIRRLLQEAIRLHRLYRVETTARLDTPRDVRWVEMLGFTLEQDSIARHHSPDACDVYRYELVTKTCLPNLPLL